MTDTIHIMLAIKAWGTRPGCDIRSIGAVMFNPHTGAIDRAGRQPGPFYIATENPGCNVVAGGKYNLYRDPEIVKWWNDQSQEAQAAFANPVDLRKVCEHFTSWIRYLPTTTPSEGFNHIRIWSNSSHFDVAILQAVYHAIRLPVPWHHEALRDLQTITDAANMTHEEFSKFGDEYNAMHNAIAQATTVCEAWHRIGRHRLCD